MLGDLYAEACSHLDPDSLAKGVVSREAVLACMFDKFKDKQSLGSWTTYKVSLIRAIRLKGLSIDPADTNWIDLRLKELYRSLASSKVTSAQKATPVTPRELLSYANRNSFNLATISVDDLSIFTLAVCMCVGMLRFGEAFALTWADLTLSETHATIRIKSPKERRHDSPGFVTRTLPEQQRPWLSPLVLLRTLRLKQAGRASASRQIFCPPSADRWPYRTAHDHLTKFLRIVNPTADQSLVRTHSLRSGGATFYLLEGANRNAVMSQGRWTSGDVADSYCRPTAVASAKHLSGLL